MKKTNLLVSGEAPVLREVAKPVPVEEISSARITDIIERMTGAMNAERDGVAIAAPQIGENVRIFIASSRIPGLERDLVFINPEIVRLSKQRQRIEEGCLSLRWLYGEVERAEKARVRAYDKNGKVFELGGAGLLAQVFQHEIDHLDGILFIDKAKGVRNMPPTEGDDINFVFFGSSEFSDHVLNSLRERGFEPALIIDDARAELPMDELREIDADVFVVASFGKILPKELIYMPRHKTLNVHPSLLPKLRGPAPIQNTILQDEGAGVSIMRLDEEMDHGPIVAKKMVDTKDRPRYEELEKILGEVGGNLLADILPQWTSGELQELPQDHSVATYTRMIKKEDGLIDLNEDPEANMRKLRAYSRWPGIFINFKKQSGKEIRVIIRDAQIIDGKFIPKTVLPEGKKEMGWEDFLRGAR